MIKTDNTCQVGLVERDEISCHLGEFCLLACVLLASFGPVTHSSPVIISWKDKIARGAPPSAKETNVFLSSIRVLNLTLVYNYAFYFTYFNIHFEMEFHFRQ